MTLAAGEKSFRNLRRNTPLSSLNIFWGKIFPPRENWADYIADAEADLIFEELE